MVAPGFAKPSLQDERQVKIAARHKEDRLSVWINRLRDTRGINKATVALANKLARIGWAVLSSGTGYQPA